MQKRNKLIIATIISVVLLAGMFVVVSSAESKVDNNTYKSYSAIGDSIAAGFGPLMDNNKWANFYYAKPPVGSYPYELTKDLGLDMETGFNSMLCVDQRLLDVYYAMGGNPEPVVNPDKTDETLDYLEDAREYHSESYMKVLEDLHTSGEGGERIKNSELITIQIGFADLAVYPLKRTKDSGDYNYFKAINMIRHGLVSYEKYYPKMLKLIKELNPNAKILLLSQYDPYEKFVFEGKTEASFYKLVSVGIKALNVQLKIWCKKYGCTYVDITGLGEYVDNETTTVPEGELVNLLIDHENHPGAGGHRYIENQILKALDLERASKTPSTNDAVDYLAFTGDVHNADDGKSAARLDSWLNNVSEKLGDITFDYMGFCGDVGSANVGGKAYANKVQIVMDTIANNINVESGIFVTGNHEYSPGKYATQSSYKPYSNYIRFGEAANTEKYQIFSFGVAQNSQKFNDEDIEALDEYLSSADKSKPVFVLSHFPIHSYGDRVTTNAAKVIDVLNKYPNVIFLWGHNHTLTDSNYGIVNTDKLEGKSINFAYCAAGCMSDSDYQSGSGKIAEKGLVAEIDGDDDLTLTYYDKNYNEVTSYVYNIKDGSAEEVLVNSKNFEHNFDGKIYSPANTIEDGGEYVIAVGNKVLNSTPTTGYNTNSGDGYNYTYSGYKGAEVLLKSKQISAGLTSDEVWTFKVSGEGYTIQNSAGKYLTSFYTDHQGGGLTLVDSAGGDDIWTYSANHLKNKKTGKHLNFETESDVSGVKQWGETDIFTIRSGAGDTTLLYSAETPKPIVVTDYEGVTGFEDGKWYIITAEENALISKSNSGYVTDNGGKYKYSGLDGKWVSIAGNYITSKVSENMLWKAETYGYGFTLTNKAGNYLNSSYTKPDGYNGIGSLTVGSTKEAWVLSGTELRSLKTDKKINYQNEDDIDGTKKSGNSNFFTIRTDARDIVSVFSTDIEGGMKADEDEVIDYVASRPYIYYSLFTGTSFNDGDRIVMVGSSSNEDKTSYYVGTDRGTGFQSIKDNKYYQYTGISAHQLSEKIDNSVVALPTTTEDYTEWVVEKVSDENGVYYLRTVEGKYLSATFEENKTITLTSDQSSVEAAEVGDVKLVNVVDDSCKWKIRKNENGNLALYNINSEKYLEYNDNKKVKGDNCVSGNSVSCFTARSVGGYLNIYKKVDASCNLVKNASLADGAKIVFTYDKYAMGSGKGAGYKNKNSGGYYYWYSGLSSKDLGQTTSKELATLASAPTTDIVWTVETSGTYYKFKNANGYYLSASYSENDFEVSSGGNYYTVKGKGVGKVTLKKESDDYCKWELKNENGVVELKNKGCGKILTYNNGSNVDGDILEPNNKDDVSVFTVRTSRSNKLYIYQLKATEQTINTSQNYVIVSEDGYALSSDEGRGYNDAYSKYRYDGLDAVEVKIVGKKITTPITSDMVWSFVEAEGGYYIKNSDGKYLNSYYEQKENGAKDKGIRVFFSENPEVWTYKDSLFTGKASNKQLSHQTNQGETSVFTLRSSGQKFTLYEMGSSATKTALYTATVGGTVSCSKEVLETSSKEPFKGSTATAKTGYEFDGWYNKSGKVCENLTYTPNEAGVYTAHFKETKIKINYAVKISGDGGSASDIKLIGENEEIGFASGTLAGCTAPATEGYTFLYWTSDAEGESKVSELNSFVPKNTGVETSYYAWYQKAAVCHGAEATELDGVVKGNHSLLINGTNCGKFAFTQTSDGWTIYSVANKKFLTVNESGELAYSSVAKAWTYSSKGFSVIVDSKILFVPIKRTYYLNYDSGALITKTSAPSKIVIADMTDSGYSKHLITDNTSATPDTTHAGICARCGQTISEEAHSYTYSCLGDGTHKGVCICGKTTAAENCTFNSGVCSKCGGSAPADNSVIGVTVKVEEGKQYANFIAKLLKKYYTVYDVELTPIVKGTVETTVVSYKTDKNGQYIEGSKFSSSTSVDELWIMVKASGEAVTYWHYSNGITSKVI